MMHSEILKPVVVLIGWSLVMLVWLVVARLPAMKAAGIDIARLRGSRPGGLDGTIPDHAQWPAHNYMHLMEQPTLFYAVAIVLAITGAGDGVNALLAWGYVLARIAHSIVQATFNRVAVRFMVFAVGSLFLIALALHAAMTVF